MTDHRRNAESPDSDVELSRAGRARREVIRGNLHDELDARKRRVSILRGIVAFSMAGAALAATIRLAQSPPSAPVHLVSRELQPEPSQPRALDASGSPRIALIETDPTITRRLAAPSAGSSLRMISDDELVALAASTGQSCGLMRTGETVTMLPCGGEAPAIRE